MRCKYHACENTVNQENTIRTRLFCNSKCMRKYYVDRRRLELKFKAVRYKGGKCELCGHKGLPASFDFHHTNPKEKEFAISQLPHTRSWERLKTELDKCQLLCANCHREVEFKKTMSQKLFIPDLIKKYCGSGG
jgi:5-methylcytosine-specific restriction endonuclease McrA